MTAFRKIGLMTPGDMGQGVAMQIQARGFKVCTALDGRSERSRILAREAGLTDVGSIARLVAECDVVLSVMNPGAALEFGRQAADAIRNGRHNKLVVDCNAVAPTTAVEIADMVEEAGGAFVDAGIIGPPPRGNAKITLYVSGPRARELEQIDGPQLKVQLVSDRIGDASALKMCSGALTKGTQALWLEVMVAARRLGVHELLEHDLREGPRSEIYKWVMDQLAIMPPKAYRWVPEMQEVSKTMAASGFTPQVFAGVADICAAVGNTSLGAETPEQGRAGGRSGAEVVRLLARDDAGSRIAKRRR